ncbi:MAG: flagellar basal body-associated FliL family protein [Deltaproteobacteria bacterium]|jgi:flagellar FliL protein|nr:flagellar basal body-associated FliL family protein [Deltaproteobacteria bacterium]
MAEKKTKQAKAPAPEPEAPPAKFDSADVPKKSGLNIKLLAIVLVAMVVGGIGAFAAMKLLSGPKPEPMAQEFGGEFADQTAASEEEDPIVAPTKGEAPAAGGHGASGGEGEGAAVVEGPQIIPLDPFTTNINDGTGRRFLKVSLSLEVEDQAAADELKKMMPKIQDKILMLLSSQSMESISTTEGKERLRSQIMREANIFMGKYKIRKVNYSQFIIQ